MSAKKASKKKASKKVAKKVETVDHIDTINELLDRVAKLEKRQQVIVDAFKFTADEARPVYGLGAISVIFDAIYKKLSK